MKASLRIICVIWLAWLLPGMGYTQSNIIYDNGPLWNSPGTGVDGFNEYVADSTVVVYGWNMNNHYGFRTVDVFTTCEVWNVDSFYLNCYIYGLNEVEELPNLQLNIYSSDPAISEAIPIYSTNEPVQVLSLNGFLAESRANSGQRSYRRYYRATIPANITLNPARYWIEASFDGGVTDEIYACHALWGDLERNGTATYYSVLDQDYEVMSDATNTYNFSFGLIGTTTTNNLDVTIDRNEVSNGIVTLEGIVISGKGDNQFMWSTVPPVYEALTPPLADSAYLLHVTDSDDLRCHKLLWYDPDRITSSLTNQLSEAFDVYWNGSALMLTDLRDRDRGEVQIHVLASDGRLFGSYALTGQQAASQYRIHLPDLATGVYWVSLDDGSELLGSASFFVGP